MYETAHLPTLKNKRILLGVCGGIAAYKIAYLIRFLKKNEAEVRVVMTPEATNFIGALTLSVLSKNPVAYSFYDEETGVWNNHVELGLWANVFLIAPATANTIAKMAAGICDNILLAAYLSARAQVFIAPAMDLDMWKHDTAKKNINALITSGVKMIAPQEGELASGLSGEGRMAEPQQLAETLHQYFLSLLSQQFKGQKILITAGPTYEKLDPVRFIGNYSSGKMGFALAKVFQESGAQVTVVHGPVQKNISSLQNVKTIFAESAIQMFEVCKKEFIHSDLFIAAAAVADFTPIEQAIQKIKKSDENEDGIVIKLKRNPDILAQLSSQKKQNQTIVGFALETGNGLEHAKEKLKKKGCDIIVLNSLQDAGAGFQHDTNKITILDKNNNTAIFELKDKREAAADIANFIYHYLHA